VCWRCCVAVVWLISLLRGYRWSTLAQNHPCRFLPFQSCRSHRRLSWTPGGGYHSLAPNDTTPAVGVLLIEINLPPRDPRDPRDPPKHSRDDPRIGSVLLPVRDGYARVVDARMAAGEILVFVRTEGGSTYTYDVNSHTLTQTGGPTATPLPPGAPTPTVPHKAP